jgi:hypothetical protein
MGKILYSISSHSQFSLQQLVLIHKNQLHSLFLDLHGIFATTLEIINFQLAVGHSPYTSTNIFVYWHIFPHPNLLNTVMAVF